MVFRLGLDEFEWFQDSTAYWRYPNGVAYGGIQAKMHHPVTCISYVDALAYCEWANVRLPTLEEWEVASRGGNFTDAHYFGDQPKLIHDHANIWQGKSHFREYEEEDYVTTSPVGTYKPNPFGLYDMYGNVFEYCSNLPKVIEGEKSLAAARGGFEVVCFGSFQAMEKPNLKDQAFPGYRGRGQMSNLNEVDLSIAASILSTN